jgi:hypothetical protein
MKFLGLIFISVTMIGCGSQEIDKSSSKEITASSNSSSQSLAFLNIKPASDLGSSAKTNKKGKEIEVNGEVVQIGTLGGSESFVENVNNGYVVGGSAVPMPSEEVQGDVVTDLAVHAFVHKDGVIKDLGTLGGAYSSSSGVK